MDGPSKVLLGLEAARGLYEYGLGWLLAAPLHFISPRGDGHPVMIIPGFGGTDRSTYYLSNFLNSLGYSTHPWGLGRNLGPREGMDKLLCDLVGRVSEISATSSGKKVSLVGWSLGGIYGREIAKQCPEMVRQVITLGTPFKSIGPGTNITRLYEMLNKDTSHKNPAILERLCVRPPVPYTSIYSKTDGVVSWKCSIEEETHISENIEIPGASHLGLGYNPFAMYMIANRLSQPLDAWKPFKI